MFAMLQADFNGLWVLADDTAPPTAHELASPRERFAMGGEDLANDKRLLRVLASQEAGSLVSGCQCQDSLLQAWQSHSNHIVIT